MYKKVRISAFLLAIVLLSTLTGCTSGGGESSPSDLSDHSSSKISYDFLGEKVTIVDQYDTMLSLQDDRFLARIAQVEKDFNVDIEIVSPKGNYGAGMIASIVSGSPAGHILTTRASSVVNLYVAGVFADLTAAMEKTGIDFKDEKVYNTYVTKYTNIDGQQLCFEKRRYPQSTGLWMFNKRIFSEMNLGNPYELYEKGEWTWDKVEEIASKATIRQSDGTVTQWGLGAYMAMPMVASMVLQNGGQIARFNADGKPEIALKDPKTIEALERFNSWYNVKKILRTNYGNEVWDTVYKEFPEGNIAMFAGFPLSYAIEANMKDEYGVVGAPKSSAGASYQNPVSDFTCFFIPKTYEAQADRYITLMDALWQPFEDVTIKDLVIESFAEKLYDSESLNMIISLNEKPLDGNFDAYQLLNLEWLSPNMMDLVTALIGGQPVGAVADSFQTMFEENVHENWGELTLTGK